MRPNADNLFQEESEDRATEVHQISDERQAKKREEGKQIQAREEGARTFVDGTRRAARQPVTEEELLT